MAQQLVDRRDIDFVIWEQLNLEEDLLSTSFKTYNKKTCNMIIDEARKIAINDLYPTMRDGDKTGLIFENGEIHAPESYYGPFKTLVEGDWINVDASEEIGGQGVPNTVASSAQEYFMAANWPLFALSAQGIGSAKMIDKFGSQQQKDIFVKKLVAGKWGGSMLLTESDAGSDVGALITSAKKNEDGSYQLTGTKIFITGGEIDFFENIIHPVLARVEGAPEGTKGISIFLVPKFLINEDGTLGERNDIWCTGIEHKHGIRSSSTCTMTLGAKGKCVGYLMGEENKGMKIMFNLMNHARMATGMQALAYGSAAYLQAVNYARERIQSRELGQPHSAPPVAIIKHPDVRRNLLWMKSYVDGLRSFFYYTVLIEDKNKFIESEEEKKLQFSLFELLTPIIKSFIANRCYEVCVQSMQVFGGVGYTEDYIIEQYVRDCKITSIYEGTCGIQAADLLGRKLGKQKGQVFMKLLSEMQATISQAKTSEGLTELAGIMEKMVNRLGEVAMTIGMNAMNPEKFKAAFAHSLPFLNIMGETIVAWMLLWRAKTATDKLQQKPGKKDTSFYNGQIKTAEFFFKTVVPEVLGKMEAVFNLCPAAIEMEEDSFGSL